MLYLSYIEVVGSTYNSVYYQFICTNICIKYTRTHLAAHTSIIYIATAVDTDSFKFGISKLIKINEIIIKNPIETLM